MERFEAGRRWWEESSSEERRSAEENAFADRSWANLREFWGGATVHGGADDGRVGASTPSLERGRVEASSPSMERGRLEAAPLSMERGRVEAAPSPMDRMGVPDFVREPMLLDRAFREILEAVRKRSQKG